MAYSAGGSWSGACTWASGVIATNPSDGAVLVDTGVLTAGNYLFAITGTGSAAWVYDLQHRNAANDGNVDSQRRRPAAGNEDFPLPNKITIAAGQRLRAVLVGAVTGEIQMSIFAWEVQ
jgi:hypothetical protein